jgi:hypothetical protein
MARQLASDSAGSMITAKVARWEPLNLHFSDDRITVFVAWRAAAE